jgi:DNA ligase 1
MAKLFKPMLAAKPDPEELDAALAGLRYPVLGSPKFDGVRATVQGGVLLARKLTPVANLEMQALWGRKELDGLDGEIVVGAATAPECFNLSSGVARSRTRPADEAVFRVFDKFGHEAFRVRSRLACAVAQRRDSLRVEYVKQTALADLAGLLAYEKRCLAQGHEGVMLRDPGGLYKQGRSTMREGGLVAVKRFTDAEAVVVDTYEQEENTNEQTLDKLGRLKRSAHKAGKVGKGTLGGFYVERLDWDGVDGFDEGRYFNIGTGVGLTDAVRAALWRDRKALPGRIVKYRYQACGTKDRPRIPIFLGFRDKEDM